MDSGFSPKKAEEHMKTFIIILLLFILLTATACESRTAPEDATVNPTPAISAEDLVEMQCPLNDQTSSDANTKWPRVYFNGMCGFHFAPGLDNTLIGVFIGYPAGWTLVPTSEDGTAIILELEPRVVYIQAFPSDLPLEQADQVTYNIEPGLSEPLVLQEEITKDKSIQSIGDKEVLILTTVLSEQTIWRAFLSRSASGKLSTLYMFQITVLTPEIDNSQLIGFVETLISNMSFDQ